MKVQLKVRFTRSLLISFNPYCEIKEKLSVGAGVSLGPIRCLGVLFEQEGGGEHAHARKKARPGTLGNLSAKVGASLPPAG